MNAKLTSISQYITKQNVPSRQSYSASEKTLKAVWNGLNGKFSKDAEKFVDQNIFGPNFFADKTLEKDILCLINNQTNNEVEIVNKLSKSKKAMQNTWSLLLGKEPPQKTNTLNLAKRFIKDLKTEVNLIDETCNKLNFSEKEKGILHDFIANTAAPLHLMGFKDAIPHAAEVSRLCIVEAKKQGAKSTTELLQAAMTGWMHDPKLAGYLSKDNLATHPIVASALAKNVLSTPQMKKKLLDLHGGDKTKTKQFINGIEKALGINNDSLFVTQNVILNGKIKASISSAEKFNSISEKAVARYWHNSQNGLKLKRFNREEVKTLRCIKFETGLKGINKTDFAVAYNNFIKSHNSKYLKLENGEFKSSTQVLKEIASGEITDLKLIKGLHKELQKLQFKVKSVDVSALNLFTHNAELTDGKIAAHALVTADPKLLSLHKVVQQTIYPDIPSRVTSFLESFDNNINGLESKAIADGKTWQEDYLKSLVACINRIAHSKPSPNLDSKLSSLTQQERIDMLKKMIVDSEAWIAYKNIADDSKQFKKLVKVFEKDYHIVTETSTGLYKTP